MTDHDAAILWGLLILGILIAVDVARWWWNMDANNKKYTCPICFYPELADPPQDYLICPCCGVEFGYSDFEFTNEELRRGWIMGGMKWFSRVTPPPENWDATRQIREHS